MHALRCPRCGIALTGSDHSQLSVCRRCGGLWVAFGADLTARAAAISAEASAQAKVRPADSPSVICSFCRVQTTRHTQDGINIDVCTQHGVWFDRDELGRWLENAQALGLGAIRARAWTPPPSVPVTNVIPETDASRMTTRAKAELAIFTIVLTSIGATEAAKHGPAMIAALLKFVERLMGAP